MVTSTRKTKDNSLSLNDNDDELKELQSLMIQSEEIGRS